VKSRNAVKALLQKEVRNAVKALLQKEVRTMDIVRDTRKTICQTREMSTITPAVCPLVIVTDFPTHPGIIRMSGPSINEKCVSPSVKTSDHPHFFRCMLETLLS